MMVYKIEFHAFLPKISIYFFKFRIKVGSGFFLQLSRIRIKGKKINPHPWLRIQMFRPDPVLSELISSTTGKPLTLPNLISEYASD